MFEDLKALVKNKDFAFIASVMTVTMAAIFLGYYLPVFIAYALASVGVVGYLYLQWFMDFLDEKFGSILDVEEEKQ